MLEAVIGSVGVLLGILLNRLFDRLNRRDVVVRLENRVEQQEAENCLLCYGLAACLDGLNQLGANHDVPKAKDRLDKYLNKKAHRLEEY